jgi:hypothetical protein
MGLPAEKYNVLEEARRYTIFMEALEERSVAVKKGNYTFNYAEDLRAIASSQEAMIYAIAELDPLLGRVISRKAQEYDAGMIVTRLPPRRPKVAPVAQAMPA